MIAMFLAKIHITLKPTVNDPQGKTILSGLQSLGFDQAIDVRTGKYLEVRLRTSDPDVANALVESMCDKLLANTVIESYHYNIEQLSG
jgi:phosphoribosylformylglycinamidine synthase